MKKKDEGFTLIELLIVIVILGILATVVVFAVSGIRNRGDESACHTEYRTILTGLEAHYAEEGEYPETLAEVEDEYMQTTLQYWTTDTAVGDDGTFPGPNVANAPANCPPGSGGAADDGDGD